MTSEIEKLGAAHIRHFCGLVYSQQYEPAVIGLMEILHAIELGGLSLRASAGSEEISRFCTVLSSAVTALFSDPKFNVNRQGFSALIVLKCHLRSVFAASSFGDMSHIVDSLGQPNADGSMVIPAASMQKYLLVCTLDIAPTEIVDVVGRLPEEQRMLFWLSCLDNKYIVSAEEEALRLRMLELGETLTNCSANSIGEVQSITRAWMYCSYWDYPEKHSVKRVLNQVLLNTLKKLGVVEPPLKGVGSSAGKPRVVVFLELWEKDSAMYRCYANAISRLRPDFHVTAFAQSNIKGSEAADIFDQVIEFSVDESPKDLVERLCSEDPDIIFYPSIGMQQTAVFFAQLRLAPIQVMSAGHPASSFSTAMDYMVFEEDFLNDPDCFTEQLVLLKRGAITLRRPAGSVSFKPVIAENPDVINIAVNSMYFKITNRFLRLCEELANRSSRKLHFHFIIGLNSFTRIPIERTIRQVVSSCSVYEYLDYDAYLETIGSCDIQLVPFPFGNTNSFVDAALAGLPTVCLDGAEIHSHTDAVFAQRLGLPAFCITRSEEEYLESALQLIGDDAQRVAISREVLNADLDEVLFGTDDDPGRDDLAEVFTLLYEKHDAIRNSGRKVWRVADRSLLAKD